MDEVIGVTNGYGCRNRRKSRTVGYLLNQSTSRVLRLQGGGALLRRQLRFLVASFWRLASWVGGLVSNKLPSASVKSLSKKKEARMVGKGARPTSMERGAVSQPFLYNYLSPNMITNEDRELQEDEMNHVLIGTIEERNKMVAPFAQGTSSENNVGDRVRTFLPLVTPFKCRFFHI